MEQNREVWAVPGNITSRNSFGTNYLIKGAGAKLVQQWQDVVAEFPRELAAELLPPPSKKKTETLVQKLELAPRDLTVQESTVFQALNTDDAIHIDTLATLTGFGVPELTGALLGLEMRELIRQLPGKCFVRKL